MGGEDTCPRGLPDMTPAERDEGAKTGKTMVTVLSVVPALIGLDAIYSFGSTAKYDAKLAIVTEAEMYWVYLGAFVISRMVGFVNTYPMIFKSRVMRGKSGNLRANMYIFKLIGEQSSKPNAVVLDEDGDAGVYNRANRSMHHMVENSPALGCVLVLSGFVFPFPACVLACAFALGRVVHQVGYTSGYGAHAPGFMLSMLAMEGLCGQTLLVALKGLSVL